MKLCYTKPQMKVVYTKNEKLNITTKERRLESALSLGIVLSVLLYLRIYQSYCLNDSKALLMKQFPRTYCTFKRYGPHLFKRYQPYLFSRDDILYSMSL